jgi:hypothetical protein
LSRFRDFSKELIGAAKVSGNALLAKVFAIFFNQNRPKKSHPRKADGFYYFSVPVN